MPSAESLEALNEKLLATCREDEARTISGRAQSDGEATRIESEQLLRMAAEGFEIEESSFPKVDATGAVKVLTNFNSTP